MLDEQLSMGIDAVLNRLKIQAPAIPKFYAPQPALPAASLLPPPMARLPPTPPQLPMLDFPNFNLNNMPDFKVLDQVLPMPSPAIFSPLPKWCPPLPAFTRNGTWSNGLPIFYDLSSLPEVKEPPKVAPSCQELQLWRSKLDLKPKQQSRFFPSTPSPPKPQVKLPPTRCTLHALDTWLEHHPRRSSLPQQIKPKDVGEVVELIVRSSEKSAKITTSPPAMNAHSAPSAANLWSILNGQNQTMRDVADDPYLASFEQCAAQDPYLAAYETSAAGYTSPTLPAELEGKEVPYVHANSLTGFTNEIGLSPCAEEHTLVDSMLQLSPTPEPPVGLNEMMMDYGDHDVEERSYSEKVVAAYRSESTTPSTPFHQPIQLADVLPINCVRDEDDSIALVKSGAQFHSEQQLFEKSSLPLNTPATSIISIADFLKMGHAPDCWCHVCEDDPKSEQASQAKANEDSHATDCWCLVCSDEPELVENDKLVEQDGWMLYSLNDSDSTATEVGSEDDDEERQMSRMRCGVAPEWDGTFQYKPSAWEVGQTNYDDEGSTFGAGYAYVEDSEWFGGRI